jgi:hypothetical protein
VSEQLADDVRSAVAEQHGLPEAAVGFLVGDTLEELETSAGQLAELLSSHQADPEPEPGQELTDVLASDPAAAKAAKHAAVVRALHGPPEQPRHPQTGQFVSRPSLDGGARQPAAAAPPSPEDAHNRFVAELAAASKTGARGQV